MRKALGTMGMAMIAAVMAPALPPSVELVPVPVQVGTLFMGYIPIQRYGYIDLSGEMVIPPRYNTASWFDGDVAIASIDHPDGPHTTLRGLIDARGRWVLSARYAGLRFAQREPQRFWARHDEYWFLIDRSGDVVFATECSEVSVFSEGLAVVGCGERTVVIDDRGVEQFSPSDLGFNVTVPNAFRDGRLVFFSSQWRAGYNTMGFLDRTGAVAIPVAHYVAGAHVRFSEGFFAAVLPSERAAGRDPGFFMTPDGQPAFGDRRWLDVRPFSEGRAAVAVRGSNGRAVWGFIDRTGTMVIEPRFADVERFSDGRAAVALELDTSSREHRRGRWGAIDTRGEMVIPPRYVQPFVLYAGATRLMDPIQTERTHADGSRTPLTLDRPIFINRFGDIIWDTAVHGRLPRTE